MVQYSSEKRGTLTRSSCGCWCPRCTTVPCPPGPRQTAGTRVASPRRLSVPVLLPARRWIASSTRAWRIRGSDRSVKNQTNREWPRVGDPTHGREDSRAEKKTIIKVDARFNEPQRPPRPSLPSPLPFPPHVLPVLLTRKNKNKSRPSRCAARR